MHLKVLFPDDTRIGNWESGTGNGEWENEKWELN